MDLQMELQQANRRIEDLLVSRREDQRTGITGSETSAAAIRSDVLRQLASLRGKTQVFFNLPTLTPDGKLTDAVIKIFDLSHSEVAQMQLTVDNARAILNQHRIASAKLEKADESSLVVSVPPYEDAAALYTSTTDAFESILGKDRFATFHAMQSDSLFKDLNSFGGQRTTYSVFSEANQFVLSEMQDLGKAGKPVTGGTFLLKNTSSLPERYKWMTTKFSEELGAIKPTNLTKGR